MSQNAKIFKESEEPADFYTLSNDIAQKYSLMLLNWAYRKLGDRNRAEDLAQEVLLQVFAAVKKNCNEKKPVENVERLIWKIAHYVWCHYLRQKTYLDKFVLTEAPEAEDTSDFVREFADAQERQELVTALREYIVRLDFLQREILISFYIDRQPQQAIAKRLKISEGAVKWHLFETRKKLRKELEFMMETGKNNSYVYRPKKLRVGICGQVAATGQTDTQKLRDSLIRQNICAACYEKSKNIDELAGMLGIPKAYLEFDLQWLVEKEFITEQAGRYSTSFLIHTEEEKFGYYKIYYKMKEQLSDPIINGLLNACEKVREIGFYGSDAPIEKLLWLLIYRFSNYFDKRTWNSAKASIRPDGGRYFPLGFIQEKEGREELLQSFVQQLKELGTGSFAERFVQDTFCWDYNGGMQNDNFYWFGVYDFGKSDIENLMDGFTPYWERLHRMLCTILHSDFDASWIKKEQQEDLALLVEKGFVKLEGTKAIPSFAVFTTEQYERLTKEVFEPLAQKLEPVYNKLKAELETYYKNRLPEHLKEYQELQIDNALGDIGWITMIFAFEQEKLLVPEKHLEREFLTMMYFVR